MRRRWRWRRRWTSSRPWMWRLRCATATASRSVLRHRTARGSAASMRNACGGGGGRKTGGGGEDAFAAETPSRPRRTCQGDGGPHRQGRAQAHQCKGAGVQGKTAQCKAGEQRKQAGSWGGGRGKLEPPRPREGLACRTTYSRGRAGLENHSRSNNPRRFTRAGHNRTPRRKGKAKKRPECVWKTRAATPH
jgi:hypothetical protein